jgi:hypothetical protein
MTELSSTQRHLAANILEHLMDRFRAESETREEGFAAKATIDYAAKLRDELRQSLGCEGTACDLVASLIPDDVGPLLSDEPAVPEGWEIARRSGGVVQLERPYDRMCLSATATSLAVFKGAEQVCSIPREALNWVAEAADADFTKTK